MAKKEEIELTVESTTETAEIKLNEDAIKKVEEERENLKKELDEKVYLVSKDIEYGKSLQYFVNTEAEWKFTESLGVIELASRVSKFVDGTEKTLSLDALALQAAHYFMGKKEGKGFESALSFKNLLKPVSECIGRMNADKKKFEELEFRLVSLQQGIDPDEPITDESKK